jgi:lipid II isoglutaminyl synthase (glutamine-hydrolysing)
MKPIQIVHLYPREMNIYGDTGNRIVLEKRLQWRGIRYATHLIGVTDAIPKDADIIIGGGGQDAAQGGIEQDLFTKKQSLEILANSGVVMLMVCGMYQLFGKKFVTTDGTEIKGLGILDVETLPGDGRLIGNLVTDVPDVGTIVGYENHSGRTYLGNDVQPFARVLSGMGNDDSAELEGARYKNVIGTYMHGPILSKNPHLADMLLTLALQKYGTKELLTPLDDSLADMARELASKRPR